MTLSKFTARRLSAEEIRRLWVRAVSEFSHLEGLEEILLFGSAVTGTMSEASDLDLVLIFSSPEVARTAAKILYTLRRPPLWPTDALCVSRKEYEERSRIGGVLFVARTEGQKVYERKISL